MHSLTPAEKVSRLMGHADAIVGFPTEDDTSWRRSLECSLSDSPTPSPI